MVPQRLCLFFAAIAALMAAMLRAPAALGADFVNDAIPNRWFEPLVPEDLPALVLPKYFSDFERASAQCDAGRYKLSLQTLWQMRGDARADPAAVAALKARDLLAVGRGDEALAAVSEPSIAVAAAVRVERARVLASLGRNEQAIAQLQSLLRAQPGSLAGHLELGQISEKIGDLATARNAYGWFIAPGQDYLNKWRGRGERLFEDDPNGAADAVIVGRALDRWATLNGQYARDASLNDAILDIFVKTYDVLRRGDGPAHLAAAEDYVAHDDADDAQKEALAALRANPNDAGALALLGKLAVMGFNFDGADAAVDAIRRENPTSIDADLLEVRNLLRQQQPKAAEAGAQAILQRRPKQIEAMELVAAAAALQLHDAQTAALLKQLDQISPNNPAGYFEVAEQLAAMRQYPRAAAAYQTAIDRAPWWPAPRNGLGLLYTQSGDEDLARATLDSAHAMDPYDLETTNYLRLLDQLATFARKESAHFIVEYDPQTDPVIPEYFSDYLESVYPQVTSEYHTEPARKTIIEVFPTHDAFSVRTTGTPWIGTVGASTGRIIAMVAPRKGENTMGPFNWSQVLRHEFTHTVTLAATDNRISHWMTEGLAVREEHSPLQWAWVPMLYHAVTNHELFDMDQLTWAFVRPRKQSDRQLAYAESFWICTYIEQKYGHGAVLKMLADFKNGGLQQDVFPRELGRTQEQFFADFSAWAQQQVSTWGYDPATSKKYDELRSQGEELIQQRDYASAVGVWEQIAALRPVDELPHRKLAGLYLTSAVHQPARAIAQLKILHQLDLNNDAYAKRISRLYRDTGDLPDAEHFALQSIYIDPYDLSAHELLAEIAAKTGDQPALAREQRVIPILKQWTEAREHPSDSQ